jgi:hypothetical protein
MHQQPRLPLNSTSLLILLCSLSMAFALYCAVTPKVMKASTAALMSEAAASGRNALASPAVNDIVSKALALEALLTPSQLAKLEQSYSHTFAARWSNLPCGAACRNGLSLGEMTPVQLQAALALIRAATGSGLNEGYDEFGQIRMADDILKVESGGGGGTQSYGAGTYALAFLNTPTTTGPWMLQFGGHHYATNIAFVNGQVVSTTPMFEGVEPASFTVNNVTYAPLANELSALRTMLASLSPTELDAAKLSQTFTDVTLAPGESNGGSSVFPAVKAGLKVGTLDAGQKLKVVEAIKRWVVDSQDAVSARLFNVYQNEMDETYIAYTGNGASGDAGSFLNANTNYVRIDGPSVWIEFVCQNGVVFPAQIHYHSIWRDRVRDYGDDLTLTVPSTSVWVGTGGSSSTTTPGTAGNVNTGYAVATPTSGTTPYATAVFSLSQNGNVVSEAGVPASPPTQSGRIYIDYRGPITAGTGNITISTGIAVANVSTQAATLTFTLRDNNGNALASGQGGIAPGEHFAKFVDQLSQVAPDFAFPATFATTVRTGSLEIASSQPVSMIALRLTVTQRGETLLTSTPVADLSAASSTANLYFPQFAERGGYKTTVVLLNTSAATETGTIALSGDLGAAVMIQNSSGTTASSFPYTIPAGGTFVFETSGSAGVTQVGSIRVTAGTGDSPVGSAIFSYTPAGVLVTEAAVPAAQETTNARIYIDKSSGHDTGIAVVNTGSVVNNITLRAFLPDGATAAGNGTMNLDANGHTARFAGQLIPELPGGFIGVLEVTSTTPFAAVSLRSLTNGRNEFLLTTFAVADATRAAPSPIVFPQIADGGGYSTQFIFISPTGGVTLSLDSFWDY